MPTNQSNATHDDADDAQTYTKTPVGELLTQSPEQYHRDQSLDLTDAQIQILWRAMVAPEQRSSHIAAALPHTSRYVESVCARWSGDADAVAAMLDAGHQVPICYQQVASDTPALTLPTLRDPDAIALEVDKEVERDATGVSMTLDVTLSSNADG